MQRSKGVLQQIWGTVHRSRGMCNEFCGVQNEVSRCCFAQWAGRRENAISSFNDGSGEIHSDIACPAKKCSENQKQNIINSVLPGIPDHFFKARDGVV